jgi:hypothetical protein
MVQFPVEEHLPFALALCHLHPATMKFLAVVALGIPAAFALLTVGGKPKLASFNPDPSTLSPRQVRHLIEPIDPSH